MRDGEIDFSGEGVNFSVKELEAEVRPQRHTYSLLAEVRSQGRTYSLLAEAGAASFWLDASVPPLVGKLSLAVEASPQQIKVSKLSFGGKEAIIRASGGFGRAPDYAGSLDISYEAEMSALARILGLPFDWKGGLEGRGSLTLTERVPRFKADFSSADLELNKFRLGNANGQVEILPKGSLRGSTLTSRRRRAPNRRIFSTEEEPSKASFRPST